MAGIRIKMVGAELPRHLGGDYSPGPGGKKKGKGKIKAKKRKKKKY